MKSALNIYTNPEKLTPIHKMTNPNHKFNQRLLRKPQRIEKSLRRMILQRQLGWDENFTSAKLPTIDQSVSHQPRRQYHKKSTNNLTTMASQSSHRKSPEFKTNTKRSEAELNLRSPKQKISLDRSYSRVQRVETGQVTDMLQKEIDKLYIKKLIPFCHIKIIKQLKSNITKSQELKLLKEELSDLESPKSVIAGLKTLCDSRQNCIDKLKSLVQSIRVDKNNRQTKLEVARKIMADLRQLNLECIQKILKWRENIQEFCHFTQQSVDIKFSLYGEDDGNYLLKMLYDTEFLKKSGQFPGCAYPDPFFLSHHLEQPSQLEELVKIRACQLLLLQQSI